MFEGLKLSPDLPPVWMAGFAVLAWALAQWLPVWHFDVEPLGRVLIWVGLVGILWSAVWFWRKKTPIEPGHAPKALIVEGPYRLNRNPIYSGLVLILLGFALNQGAASALLPVIGFAVLVTKRFVEPEEAVLLSEFGRDAQAYFDKSRRW